ncbi:hypothetical protein TrRE_jg9493, partial [Triparma retinervis]
MTKVAAVAPSHVPVTSLDPPQEGTGLEWLEGSPKIDPSPETPAADNQHVVFSASYDANAPSEDRHACLTGLELLAGRGEAASTSGRDVLFRCSLFTVLDGHGGCNVAAFASKNLLPTVAEDLAEALGATTHGG